MQLGSGEDAIISFELFGRASRREANPKPKPQP